MKRSVKEILKQAVGQLFVRIHGDLFRTIYASENVDLDLKGLLYDPSNESHVILVELCKEKIGYEPVATYQDIFYSIMSIYIEGKKKESGKS